MLAILLTVLFAVFSVAGLVLFYELYRVPRTRDTGVKDGKAACPAEKVCPVCPTCAVCPTCPVCPTCAVCATTVSSSSSAPTSKPTPPTHTPTSSAYSNEPVHADAMLGVVVSQQAYSILGNEVRKLSVPAFKMVCEELQRYSPTEFYTLVKSEDDATLTIENDIFAKCGLKSKGQSMCSMSSKRAAEIVQCWDIAVGQTFGPEAPSAAVRTATLALMEKIVEMLLDDLCTSGELDQRKVEQWYIQMTQFICNARPGSPNAVNPTTYMLGALVSNATFQRFAKLFKDLNVAAYIEICKELQKITPEQFYDEIAENMGEVTPMLVQCGLVKEGQTACAMAATDISKAMQCLHMDDQFSPLVEKLYLQMIQDMCTDKQLDPAKVKSWFINVRQFICTLN